MSDASSVAPAASLFRHRPFLFYFLARTCSEFAYQIAVVAVGWHIYALTGSAFDLGMVGLAQFLPTAVLTFISGHAADRYDRQRVVQICEVAQALASAFLAWGAFAGWLNVLDIFAAVAALGAANAFESPAAAALLSATAPEGQLPRAAALTTGAFQVASIAGPALGGLVYAFSPGAPYLAMAIAWALTGVFYAAFKIDRPATAAKEPPTLGALFAGVGLVRRNPILLGAISLDLFAVLLGGATTLMPIYARDILHTGPWGLGALRAAPALGALMMAAFLARRPFTRRVGVRMFQGVIVFGAATIVFAVSHSMWLSIAALIVLGASDTVSVVIRVSLVQLATPDAMRGRVGAVNFLFVNASNQLGGFESGVTAALLGAVPAAIVGGIGTMIVGFLWMFLFPSLRNAQRLEPAEEQQAIPEAAETVTR